MKMKKRNFKKEVLAPLSEEFGRSLVFKGFDAQEEDLRLREVLGSKYSKRNHKPHEITWNGSAIEAFADAFRQIATIVLHSKATGFGGGVTRRRIEMEYTAKRTCELLCIPYNEQGMNQFGVSRIDQYLSEYRENCLKHGYEPREPRFDLIEQVALRIANVLSPSINRKEGVS